MWRWKLLMVCALLVTAGTAQSDVMGRPTVIDGDTLEISGTRYRLAGIDAPEADQTCILYRKSYPCGVAAASALNDLSAGMPVRCVPSGKTAAGMAIATCFAGSYELSGGMVFTGWAMAMPRHGTKYAQIEREARQERRGLWRGQFVPPWEWRDAKHGGNTKAR